MTQPKVALVPGTTGHYELLRPIINQPTARQHGLAARLGVSVGKVNYCLRALMDKGCVKANNFRRSDNKWGYTHLLTPRGANAKVRLAREFPARKEGEFELLKNELPTLRTDAAGLAPRAQSPP